jgi:Mg2+/citrate symporter
MYISPLIAIMLIEWLVDAIKEKKRVSKIEKQMKTLQSKQERQQKIDDMFKMVESL